MAPGATVTYTLRLQWAQDVPAVRDVLYTEGKFDTAVAPGMAVPADLPALVSLRSRHANASIAAEFPSATRIEPVAGKPGVYSVHFSHLGENMLTVKYGNGEWASLEFFITEPLETVIGKPAAFLVSHHQLNDPSKWYYGAYSDWDQKNEIRRSPEDRDSLSTWLTDADDDAGNARPAFLASKNVFALSSAEGRADQRLLDHDGFAKEQPVVVADDLSRIQFTVENRTGGAHTTGLSIEGLPASEYDVVVGGRKAAAASGSRIQLLSLPVSGTAVRVEINRAK
jgi:hypothetical protein